MSKEELLELYNKFAELRRAIETLMRHLAEYGYNKFLPEEFCYLDWRTDFPYRYYGFVDGNQVLIRYHKDGEIKDTLPKKLFCNYLVNGTFVLVKEHGEKEEIN